MVAANGTVTLTEAMRGLPAGETWVSVDSDASGRYLVAASNRGANGSGGLLYLADTEQPDWQWRALGDQRLGWKSVSISADGKTMAAAVGGAKGGLWIITDGGAAWRQPTDLGLALDKVDWSTVELDAAGQTLFAAGLNNRLYTLPVTPVTAAPSLLVPDAIGAVAGEIGRAHV